MKEQLRALFAAALADLDPRPRVRAAVRSHRATFAAARRVRVVAIGKAARPMAAAAVEELRGLPVDGLLVPPDPDDVPLPPLEVVCGGHPWPTAGSVRAAARALELCRAADGDTFVLFLLSGGGSAMCEQPFDAEVALPEWQSFYRALVGCGAGIVAVNTVRRHLSAVKGGRLALAAAAAHGCLTLCVSDVPGDLAALASGPTLPDGTTLADCRAIVAQHGLLATLPRNLAARLERGDLPPQPRRDDPRLRHHTAERLLDNDTAIAALARHAAAAGLRVVEERRADELPVADAAALLLARLRQDSGIGTQPVAVLAGGEVRVALPEQHGRGGRNQQFALECALRMQGEAAFVLSCGTDGVDGDSSAAGAVADGTTVARAQALGLRADEHLRRCDAQPLFEAIGDAVVTGATGTNVRDLRLLVAR